MAFEVRDVYPPGTVDNTCYFCKASQRDMGQGRKELVIDTMTNIDFEGFLSICESCVLEMGRLIGMISPEQAIDLQFETAQLREDNRAVNEQLNDTLEALSMLRKVDAFTVLSSENE